MDWIRTVQDYYKKWKRYIIFIDLVFILIVFYASSYFLPLRDALLPAALIGAFGILLETLFSINDSLQQELGLTDFDDVTQALPEITKILKSAKGNKIIINIIASSGGTTINTIVPTLISQSEGSLDINLLIINPDREQPEFLPGHWIPEAKTTINRLKQIKDTADQKVIISCSTYNYIPCLHGVMIDDQHLFLGFFNWEKTGNITELSGAQQPHVYYRRTSSYENLFKLFESWFESAPKELLFNSK